VEAYHGGSLGKNSTCSGKHSGKQHHQLGFKKEPAVSKEKMKTNQCERWPWVAAFLPWLPGKFQPVVMIIEIFKKNQFEEVAAALSAASSTASSTALSVTSEKRTVVATCMAKTINMRWMAVPGSSIEHTQSASTWYQ